MRQTTQFCFLCATSQNANTIVKYRQGHGLSAICGTTDSDRFRQTRDIRTPPPLRKPHSYILLPLYQEKAHVLRQENLN